MAITSPFLRTINLHLCCTGCTWHTVTFLQLYCWLDRHNFGISQLNFTVQRNQELDYYSHVSFIVLNLFTYIKNVSINYTLNSSYMQLL